MSLGQANFLLVDVTALGVPGPEVGQSTSGQGHSYQVWLRDGLPRLDPGYHW